MGIKWIKKPESKKELPFPKLMKSSSSGAIVLMGQPRQGTVLHTGLGATPVGRYSSTWDMSYFEDYNEEFTIQNVEV
jgi:hypothetical protein